MYEREIRHLREQLRVAEDRLARLKTVRKEIDRIELLLKEVECYSKSLTAFVTGAVVHVHLDGWTEEDVLNKILHPVTDLLPNTKAEKVRRSSSHFADSLDYEKRFWIVDEDKEDSYSLTIKCLVVNSPDCEVIEYKEEVTRYKLSCKE